MKNILKYLLLLGLLLPSALPMEENNNIRDAVIIVGSTRAPGSVIKNIFELVEQDKADFTYKDTFPGSRVVSIDINTCATNQEHVQDDFITTKRFELNSQSTVLLEWFPPSSGEDILNNPMRLAIKKAYEVLKPGGTLIIDNHPFFDFLPKGSKFENSVHSLQTLNPFTFVFNFASCEKIRNYLVNGTTTNKTESLKTSVTLTSRIVETDEGTVKKTVADLLPILNAESLGKALADNTFYMFFWAYHSLSRKEFMVKCLVGCGFDVSKGDLKLFPVNPYNQRKFAWIIKAFKPEKVN